MAEPEIAPKVFVSYSWTSEEHKQWVLDLAERLTHDGINVILDRWHLQPGHDKYQFMEKMVTDATVSKVLVVCDKAYAEKAACRKGGVGTETQIISDKVYREVAQEKFIPLIRERDESGSPCMPVFMASRMYFDFSDSEQFSEEYERLIRNLHNAPELKQPAIGKPPAHIFNTVTKVSTAGKLDRLRDAAEKGKQKIEVILRDYLESLGEALEGFRITSVDNKSEPDEVVLEQIGAMQPYRDHFIEFCAIFASYLDNDVGYIELHTFFERLQSLQYPTASLGGYSEWHFDAHRYIAYEWTLYLVAMLFQYRKYQIASRLISDNFQFQHPHRRELWSQDISTFCNHIAIIEEHRNRRLNLRKYSLVADMIMQTATLKRPTFQDLIQADLVLGIRRPMLDPDSSMNWYPKLLIYAQRSGPIDIFARATTQKGQIAIRELFGCQNAKELAIKLRLLLQNHSFSQFIQSVEFRFGGVVPLLNWDILSRLLT